ncbi:MAG: questin oxidase family protein [Proteobacteria bacterium]|nr:questin oxidase family protein [Pseudomonadota bacterium]
MTAADYAPLDEALERLAGAGPDLTNGLTSHAPMAAEALCAMGQAHAVLPFVEGYLALTQPWPAAREPISMDAWRGALGQRPRGGDWRAFFAAELEREPWRHVLERWTANLAPGFCAAACHGVIRVGHAVRALALAETEARRRELGDALAAWATDYEELPTAARADRPALSPSEAIRRVPLLPPEQRRPGMIVVSLHALGDFPAFAPVIDLLAVPDDPLAAVPELAEVFARVYLGSARDALGSIIFTHGVTSVHALANLLPHLGRDTARELTRFAWQAACALYSALGRSAEPERAPEAEGTALAELAAGAAAHGDEHAIKLTEACLTLYRLRPSAVFPAAARHAQSTLPPAAAGGRSGR